MVSTLHESCPMLPLRTRLPLLNRRRFSVQNDKKPGSPIPVPNSENMQSMTWIRPTNWTKIHCWDTEHFIWTSSWHCSRQCWVLKNSYKMNSTTYQMRGTEIHVQSVLDLKWNWNFWREFLELVETKKNIQWNGSIQAIQDQKSLGIKIKFLLQFFGIVFSLIIMRSGKQ